MTPNDILDPNHHDHRVPGRILRDRARLAAFVATGTLGRGLASLALLAMAACGGRDDAKSDDAPRGTMVAGTVTDANGLPLAGVELRSTQHSTTSDADGHFELDVEAGDAVIVQLHKPGYVNGLERVTVREDVPTALRVVLFAEAPAVPLDAELGGEVLGARGARILAPAGAFVTRDGMSVTGMVEVHLTPFDPAIAAEYDAYPGDGLARTADGEPVQLETFGMLDVTVRQNGHDLTIAEGMGVEVEIPVATSAPASLPEMARLSSFDEQTGVWVEEGTLALDEGAGVYHGMITHLSPWDADLPLSPTCVRGHVQDPQERSVAGALVLAKGIDYWGASMTFTDEDGDFCVAVRKDSPVEIFAYFGGSATREVMSGVADTAVPLVCGDPTCLDGGVWTLEPEEIPEWETEDECEPLDDVDEHLAVHLVGGSSIDIDLTRLDGLETCGSVAVNNGNLATELSFFERSGWTVTVAVESGIVSAFPPEGFMAGVFWSCDIAMSSEQIAEEMWSVKGSGECTYGPDREPGGTIDFSGWVDGALVPVCCDALWHT